MDAPKPQPRATPSTPSDPRQLNCSLSPEQRAWLQKISADLGDESLAGAVRWVIDRARAEKAETELKSPRVTRKKLFLANVRADHFVELAAEEAQVKPDELEEWFRDDEFLQLVEHEQSVYRAMVCRQLRLVGEGSTKGGNAIALIEILKAVAPEFDRGKMMLIQRSWNKTLKEIFAILTSEFGDSQRDTLSSALQKIEDLFAYKLTNFAK